MTHNAFDRLATEQVNPKTKNIDTLKVRQILQIINNEDRTVAHAVATQLPVIEKAVHLLTQALAQGNRALIVGAGTSGRLGVMEAAECPPTFHTKPWQIQAVMAGARQAVFRAQEGAEDNAAEGQKAMRRVSKGDVVIGIAASGVTPFVLAALKTAKKKGCSVVLITCNASLSPSRPLALLPSFLIIAPRTGPEVIAGSTRLKAATATKMILNMITTASMIHLGKVYGNRMVDLEIKSNKLKERAGRLVGEIAGIARPAAQRYLRLARGRVKIAIVMARRDVNYAQALRLLKKHRGFLRPILKERFSDE